MYFLTIYNLPLFEKKPAEYTRPYKSAHGIMLHIVKYIKYMSLP